MALMPPPLQDLLQPVDATHPFLRPTTRRDRLQAWLEETTDLSPRVQAQCLGRALHMVVAQAQATEAWDDVPALIDVLCGAGAARECRDQEGLTPLLAALAAHPTGPRIKALVDGGVDINAVANDGLSALHRAVRLADAEPARILIEEGADPHQLDAQGLRPRDVLVHRLRHEPDWEAPTIAQWAELVPLLVAAEAQWGASLPDLSAEPIFPVPSRPRFF